MIITKIVFFFFISISFSLLTCSPIDNNPKNNGQEGIVIHSGNKVASMILSDTVYNNINTGSSSDNSAVRAEFSNNLKSLSKQVYAKFQDSFDFIIFVLNNDATDFINSSAYAQYFSVSNTVTGLGQSVYDYTSEYGSAGKLKGVIIHYSELADSSGRYTNLTRGPLLHELLHYQKIGHWNGDSDTNIAAVRGKFASVINGYAPLELYYLGMIGKPSDTGQSAFWDNYKTREHAHSGCTNSSGTETAAGATGKTYIQSTAGGALTRTPNYQNSQKDFRAIVVVLTRSHKPVNDNLVLGQPKSGGGRNLGLNDDIDWITATDVDTASSKYPGKAMCVHTINNFHTDTKKQGTLKMNELDTVTK